jgi:hypothetical protein
MMNEVHNGEQVTKREEIGYLKSKMNLMEGVLRLTPTRLILEAHKMGVGGFGILGSIMKRKVEQKVFGFDIALSEIKEITRGKHGVQKNVLEITVATDEMYRILVKDYADWESALKN